MRSILIVSTILFCQSAVRSQERFFLYVQTDNEQAFYAKVQGKTLSSTATGYLILPRISDSSLTMTIGFPRRQYPEQLFRLDGIRSDKGYLLKNFQDKGWGLFDMRTLDVVMSTSMEVPPPKVTNRPATDPFTDVLASVIDDSSLRERPVLRSTLPVASAQTKPSAAKVSVDPTVASPPAPSKTVESTRIPDRSNDSSLAAPPAPSKTVESIRMPNRSNDSTTKGTARKLLEEIDSSGVQLVFSDKSGAEVYDTISIWIPRHEGAAVKGPPIASVPAITRKFPADGPAAEPVNEQMPDRADCKAFITVKDLGLLRRRMEMLADEDAKVALAQRSFREQCFSTEQIRSLLVVFGREEGRFKLLDAAFPYVSDPSRFASMESILKDSYFIYRFRKRLSSLGRQ